MFGPTNPLFNEAQHHEDKWGNGGITPHILNLGTIWGGQFHVPAALHKGKRQRDPVKRKLGET